MVADVLDEERNYIPAERERERERERESKGKKTETTGRIILRPTHALKHISKDENNNKTIASILLSTPYVVQGEGGIFGLCNICGYGQ
jgi:hypothetical protein